jgi:hypothetical protein
MVKCEIHSSFHVLIRRVKEGIPELLPELVKDLFPLPQLRVYKLDTLHSWSYLK